MRRWRWSQLQQKGWRYGGEIMVRVWTAIPETSQTLETDAIGSGLTAGQPPPFWKSARSRDLKLPYFILYFMCLLLLAPSV